MEDLTTNRKPNAGQYATVGGNYEDVSNAAWWASESERWSNISKDWALAAEGFAREASVHEDAAESFARTAWEASEILDKMYATAETLLAGESATATWVRGTDGIATGEMHFGIPTGPEGRSDNGISDIDIVEAPVVDIDISAGFIYDMTLINPETRIVVRKTDALVDRGTQFTLLIKQGTGSNKITLETSDGSPIRWPNGLEPHLSYEMGLTDMITLLTVDGGNSYFGFMSSSGYPEAS